MIKNIMNQFYVDQDFIRNFSQFKCILAKCDY